MRTGAGLVDRDGVRRRRSENRRGKQNVVAM